MIYMITLLSFVKYFVKTKFRRISRKNKIQQSSYINQSQNNIKNSTIQKSIVFYIEIECEWKNILETRDN